MTEEKLKIELAVPNFFALPMKKVEIENLPGTGRTYFVYDGKIVAVARRSEPSVPGTH
jgi:hypothetical protein